MSKVRLILLSLLFAGSISSIKAQDSLYNKPVKNIIRYNLSGALIFGFDKYLVLGYERLINKKQSISVNVGKAELPKLVSITTDSFSLVKDLKSNGFNASVDYRFYLAKENKYHAPRGVYIGPYYSFSDFNRENQFSFVRAGNTTETASTDMDFTIHTVGFELGYQFIFWKRVALDLVLIGPGVSHYSVKAKFAGNLSEEDREQLRQALEDILTQKFPGMNYVLGDKELDADGIMRTTSLGFRYLIHIGIAF